MAKRWESRSAREERESNVSHLCAFRWPTLATTAGCYAAIVRRGSHKVACQTLDLFSIIAVVDVVVIVVVAFVLISADRVVRGQLSVVISRDQVLRERDRDMMMTTSARRQSFAGPCC